MLTGVPPFSDVPKEEVMLEHIRGLLEWPADVNPNLSEEASAMVWRMAAKEPDRRPQSALQAADELRQLEEKLRASAEFGPGEHEPTGPWMPHPAAGQTGEAKPHPARSDEEPTSEFKAPLEF
jgi:serine/threonine protein kinase